MEHMDTMKPRNPTLKELDELKRCLIENGEIDAENADIVDNSSIAVFDDYVTG